MRVYVPLMKKSIRGENMGLILIVKTLWFIIPCLIWIVAMVITDNYSN